MSTMFVVRYETRAEAAEENQQRVEQVFAELNRDRPDGLRYATFRLADGVSFVHVGIVEGETNPLTELPAFAEFQAGIGDRLVAAPDRSDGTLVGSYRAFTS